MNKSKKDSRDKMEETLDEAEFKRHLEALLAVPPKPKRKQKKSKKKKK